MLSLLLLVKKLVGCSQVNLDLIGMTHPTQTLNQESCKFEPCRQHQSMKKYKCSKCKKYGFASIYYPTCTDCANKTRYENKELSPQYYPQEEKKSFWQKIFGLPI